MQKSLSPLLVDAVTVVSVLAKETGISRLRDKSILIDDCPFFTGN